MSQLNQLALMGGEPINPNELPPYNTIGDVEIEAANVVLKSGVLSGFVANAGKEFLGGEHTLALERAFCERFGCKYAVAVNSATSGLHAALVAAGVERGDEVIVPPYSMSASATSIIMAGGVPVFVDIEPDFYCLDPSKLMAAITPKTKAIMAVNIFGQPAAFNEIKAIADKHDLCIIEDNAQAPAAQYQSEWAGGIGQLGVFSLNRHKTMQCGEGGVVVCNDELLAHRLRMVRNHGEAVLPELDTGNVSDGDSLIVGFNYRLTELQAAIALPQLERLDDLNAARIELADYLTQRLEGCEFLSGPKIRPGCTHVFYLYAMRYEQNYSGVSRDTFVQALSAEGFPVSNYVRPLYRLPLYREICGDLQTFNPANFPVVEELWKEKMIVTPICRPPLDRTHIDLMVNAIDKICMSISELRAYQVR